MMGLGPQNLTLSPSFILEPDTVHGKEAEASIPAVKCGAYLEAGIHRSGNWGWGTLSLWYPQKWDLQNRVSREEVEPRWDLAGLSIRGALDRVSSPWKVLPRVWGLRRGGLGSSGG